MSIMFLESLIYQECIQLFGRREQCEGCDSSPDEREGKPE